MIIQEAGLDFGLVQIGTICKSFITIENISNLPLTWNLLPLSHQVIFLKIFKKCEPKNLSSIRFKRNYFVFLRLVPYNH